MTTAFDAPLNEAFRSAMLALYLHEAVPNDPYLIEQGLAHQITEPNDLYEFWLLDVLVSHNVPTSPVACAIASLQQLVNSIMLNMEPGYGDTSFTPEQKKTWLDGLNRYPVFSAEKQLSTFPDLFMDPTLRLTRTDSFDQLNNDINQARIEPETIQTAVLAYLNRFEEIANLKICNGYIDSAENNFANSKYHLVGVSADRNACYVRTLDMSLRPAKGPAAHRERYRTSMTSHCPMPGRTGKRPMCRFRKKPCSTRSGRAGSTTGCSWSGPNWSIRIRKPSRPAH
ncbi:neuraminidase-like domain-containing protein [Pseudomonas sp. BIC9C]|uniref:neuraminidase-like domain-containing protein n=1 Tax=Pseudomonas sp. BIC9C TaxID=3078458 RepID=UPI002AD36ACF|nr:neuraminidase-like domain-containing protein [Pseudomonas sp. BIC9C]